MMINFVKTNIAKGYRQFVFDNCVQKNKMNKLKITVNFSIVCKIKVVIAAKIDSKYTAVVFISLTIL